MYCELKAKNILAAGVLTEACPPPLKTYRHFILWWEPMDGGNSENGCPFHVRGEAGLFRPESKVRFVSP